MRRIFIGIKVPVLKCSSVLLIHACLLKTLTLISSTLRRPSATKTQRAISKMTQRTKEIRENKLAAVLTKL